MPEIEKPRIVEESKIENNIEEEFNQIKQEIPDCYIKPDYFDQLWENDDSVNFVKNIWNQKSIETKNSEIVRYKLPIYESVTWKLS